MKKLYSIALSLGIVSAAFAGVPARTTLVEKMDISQSSYARVQMELAGKADMPAVRNATVRSVAFRTLRDMEGEYTWSSVSLLSNKVPSTVTISIVDESKNELGIYIPEMADYQNEPLIAVVDLEAGSFTIANKQKFGKDSGSDLYLYFKDVNANGSLAGGASADESVTGTIDEAKIVFPTMSVWACGDPEHETLGWWFLSYVNSFEGEAPAPENPNEGWTSIGNATFIDPWVLPHYGIDQYGQPYEVELQQNDADENIYRLVDPYRGNCPVADRNSSTAAHGYIQFNVTDPDHVSFDIVEAGYADAQAGISKFYCTNTLGYWSGYFSMEPDFIVTGLGDVMPYTTFKDGVVTLSTMTSVNEETGTERILYDACFGIQGAPQAGYSWFDSNDVQLDMTGKIIFPSATGDNGGDEEEEEEEEEESGLDYLKSDADSDCIYFNLQGIPVSHPNAGVYVMRKDGKYTKVMVK